MLAGTAEFSRVIREYLPEMMFPQSLGGEGGKGLLGRGLCEGPRWELACLPRPLEQGAVRVGEASTLYFIVGPCNVETVSYSMSHSQHLEQ